MGSHRRHLLAGLEPALGGLSGHPGPLVVVRQHVGSALPGRRVAILQHVDDAPVSIPPPAVKLHLIGCVAQKRVLEGEDRLGAPWLDPKDVSIDEGVELMVEDRSVHVGQVHQQRPGGGLTEGREHLNEGPFGWV